MSASCLIPLRQGPPKRTGMDGSARCFVTRQAGGAGFRAILHFGAPGLMLRVDGSSYRRL